MTSNADVIDAVAMELSRFSRDVVTEVHRLRDELAIEQQRVAALESEVAELRRAGIPPVSHRVLAEPVVHPVAANVDPVILPSPEPPMAAPATIEFTPLTLHPAVGAVPMSAGIDNLARVLAELSEPIAVAWPAGF